MRPVVVVTGASRGLGAGVAARFGQRGARLGLCARSLEPTGGEALCQRLDVADPDAVDRFARAVAERFGPIDAWINNAGVLEPIAFVSQLTPQALAAHLQINVVGVLNGCHAMLRHGRPDGALLNISSGAAIKGYAAWGAYCAGKAAVDRLSECLALENPQLTVHAVAPGVIDTDMQRTIRQLTPAEFPMVQKFLDLKEQEAFNTPEQVADDLWEIAFTPAKRPAQVVCRLPLSAL